MAGLLDFLSGYSSPAPPPQAAPMDLNALLMQLQQPYFAPSAQQSAAPMASVPETNWFSRHPSESPDQWQSRINGRYAIIGDAQANFSSKPPEEWSQQDMADFRRKHIDLFR